MKDNEKDLILELLQKYKYIGFDYIEQIVLFKDMKTNIEHLPNDLNDLLDYSNNCDLCSLSKNRALQKSGMGNIYGSIYFISNDSSVYYDNNSKKIIEHIVNDIFEFDLDDIYYTNILKCQIFNHNVTYENEIEICINYIFKQIDISKPKIIFTLGDCLDHFTRIKNNILELSGNTYNYNGITIIPLVSPIFLSKNPSFKDKVYNNLKKIKSRLDNR